MCLAIPGQLLSIDPPLLDVPVSSEDAGLHRTGQVSFGGIIKQISLAFVPDAVVGDYLLVHAGFALTTLDCSEAAETLMYLKMDESLPL